MRSPFASIKSWFSQGLILGYRGVEALECILGTIQVLIDLLKNFESDKSAPGAPIDSARLEAMDSKIDDLTLAVREGVNNVQRSERRVRAVVRSARQELRDAGFEHSGIEAENSELREVDGSDSEAEQLPEVPAGVGQAEHSIVPGVTVRQMQVARARRR